MKKIAILLLSLLTAMSLNAAFGSRASLVASQVAQYGQRFYPALRGGAQHMPTCPAGLQQAARGFAGRAGYAAGAQTATSGVGRALLLGGGAGLLASYSYLNTPEGRLTRAHAAEIESATEVEPKGGNLPITSAHLLDIIDAQADEQARIDTLHILAQSGKLRTMMLNPHERMQVVEVVEKHPELAGDVENELWSIFYKGQGQYDLELLKALTDNNMRKAFAGKPYPESNILTTIMFRLINRDFHDISDENQFEQAWKIALDRGTPAERTEIANFFSRYFTAGELHPRMAQSWLQQWWDKSRSNKMIHRFFKVAEYIIQNYPESATWMIDNALYSSHCIFESSQLEKLNELKVLHRKKAV